MGQSISVEKDLTDGARAPHRKLTVNSAEQDFFVQVIQNHRVRTRDKKNVEEIMSIAPRDHTCQRLFPLGTIAWGVNLQERMPAT
eukprot:4836171-Ditylum_brightwellii.AAC.1